MRTLVAAPRRTVALCVTALLVTGALVSAPTAAYAAVSCGVTYARTFDTGREFGATITITNTGDAIDGWTLAFTFAANQRLVTGWPVAWTQTAGSRQVTAASNAPWNARLAPGARISIGFYGSYTGANTDPTTFTLNGVACGPPRPAVANPYVGARVYVDPEWRAKALAEPGGDRVAGQPTAVWLDSIASISGGRGNANHRSMNLAEHLDQAVAQAAGEPMVVQVVLYNLPGRNCGRLASDGDLGPNELNRYKTEFIDPITAILGRPQYADLRIVTIIEPDSLPNLVTSTGSRPFATPLCNTMLANGGYVDGVGYALAKLGALPNVHNYLDVAHHGMIGWEDNLRPTLELLARAARASGSTPANVDGFVTNTANYSALREPFIPVTEPYIWSRWIDWNPFNEELAFAQAIRIPLVQLGFPADIGLIIDTSRNGWGGPTRPTGPSTATDVNTFVDQSRIDRRLRKGNYCNQAGAGLGERPAAAPEPGIDAYAWIKPPGESDGASMSILDSAFDRMCDPTYNAWPGGSNHPTGALPGAPPSGVWFPPQFQQLMANAYPPLG